MKESLSAVMLLHEDHLINESAIRINITRKLNIFNNGKENFNSLLIVPVKRDKKNRILKTAVRIINVSVKPFMKIPSEQAKKTSSRDHIRTQNKVTSFICFTFM